MNKLFATVYLDEDVDVLIAQLANARGFEAITTLEAGQISQSDASQLAYAVSCEAAMLTHNRADFEALAQHYMTTEQPHYGIIIAVRRPPHEIMRRLLTILNAVTADEMMNQLRYI